MNKYTHRGRLKSPLNLFPGVHILFTFHCSLGLTFCHGPSIFSRHIQRGAPERVGMEIECAAASKKTRTDRKGKQGHGNNRNLGLIFHEACLLPPAPEGVLCWGEKKKDFPFPREFGRETCMHGGSNFPLKSSSLPQSHSSLLTEDLVIAEPQFKSECDCDQTQRLSLLLSLLRQNRSQ